MSLNSMNAGHLNSSFQPACSTSMKFIKDHGTSCLGSLECVSLGLRLLPLLLPTLLSHSQSSYSLKTHRFLLLTQQWNLLPIVRKVRARPITSRVINYVFPQSFALLLLLPKDNITQWTLWWVHICLQVHVYIQRSEEDIRYPGLSLALFPWDTISRWTKPHLLYGGPVRSQEPPASAS